MIPVLSPDVLLHIADLTACAYTIMRLAVTCKWSLEHMKTVVRKHVMRKTWFTTVIEKADGSADLHVSLDNIIAWYEDAYHEVNLLMTIFKRVRLVIYIEDDILSQPGLNILDTWTRGIPLSRIIYLFENN